MFPQGCQLQGRPRASQHGCTLPPPCVAAGDAPALLTTVSMMCTMLLPAGTSAVTTVALLVGPATVTLPSATVRVTLAASPSRVAASCRCHGATNVHSDVHFDACSCIDTRAWPCTELPHAQQRPLGAGAAGAVAVHARALLSVLAAVTHLPALDLAAGHHSRHHVEGQDGIQQLLVAQQLLGGHAQRLERRLKGLQAAGQPGHCGSGAWGGNAARAWDLLHGVLLHSCHHAQMARHQSVAATTM